MKRINFLELFVLIVLSELSVVTPMFRRRGSSSSSSSAPAPEPSAQRSYPLQFFIRGRYSQTNMYINSRIETVRYNDLTKFSYTLQALDGNNSHDFANTALNTDIVSFLKNKLKIRARDNIDVLYSLEFSLEEDAYLVGNYLIAAETDFYKKCEGPHTYKLKNLYKRLASGTIIEMGSKYCIFKMRKANLTTFTIRKMSLDEAFRSVTCVFCSGEFQVAKQQEDKTKLNLRISFGGEFLDPEYILKTSKASELEEFLKPT